MASKFVQFQDGDQWARLNTDTGEIRLRDGRWPGVRKVEASASSNGAVGALSRGSLRRRSLW